MKVVLLQILLFSLGTYSQACETTSAIDLELRNPSLTDPQISFVDRWAAFHELLRRHPDDAFVHRRYQDWLNHTGATFLQERQVAEYEAAYEKNSSDANAGYLYARLLMRRDYHKGFSILTRLSEANPRNSWLHLGLAEMLDVPQLKDLHDQAAARKHLESYLQLCPQSIDPTALALIQRLGDAALWKSTAERLRRQLESRTDVAAVVAWPQLWQLESRTRSASEQDEARRLKADGLAKIRAFAHTQQPDWYRVLSQGYTDLNDTAGMKWADDELLRNMPNSAAALDVVSREWWKHPPRELLDLTAEAMTRWPNHPTVWLARFRGVQAIKGAPAATVEQAASKVVEAFERSPDAMLGTVPIAFEVARLRVERRVTVDLVPGLVAKADQWVEAKYEADRKIRYGVWAGPEYVEWFRATQHWESQRVMFDLYLKTGSPDRAIAILEAVQKSVADVNPTDRMSREDGWSQLLDMALEANQTNKARAALVRLKDLADEDPKTARSYWVGAAQIAIVEGRKLDAVGFYLNGKSKGDVAKARTLWTGLGGTDTGWDAIAKSSASPATATPNWQTRERPLPDFALEDVSGNKVSLADLKGKTVFLNLWATWCAPCREELPAVEELYRSLKDRKDVAIITLDADDNPALVKPFLDRNHYTFPVILASEYVFKTLGVSAIPHNWIIDKSGVIRWELEPKNRATMGVEVLPMLEKVKGQ